MKFVGNPASRARVRWTLAVVLPVLVCAADTAAVAAGRRSPKSRASAATSSEPADGGYRVTAGSVDLFLPATFRPIDGKYDVVLHFHGFARAQEANVNAAKLNAAVVSVNLGTSTDKYGKTFRDPRAFDALLAKTHRMVMASGRAKGSKIGRIALSAWSAGFASVGAILKNEKARARVDAVLLADGLHAAYSNPKRHVIDESSLAKYVRLSEEASRGEKLFVLTHSSIPTYGYANTTETVGTVLRLASMEKAPPPAYAPRQMQPLYQVHRGDFHVIGFEGRGVRDHIDHIWAMGETMFPLLVARWDPSAAAPPAPVPQVVAAR